MSCENNISIIIGSMPRSGSTWLFNCVKFLYKSVGKCPYSSWIGDFQDSHCANVRIVKAHEPSDVSRLLFSPSIILSTRRDIRYIAASLIRMGWDEPDEHFFEQLNRIVFVMHKYWSDISDYEVDYNDIILQPMMVINHLSGLLEIDLSIEKKKNIISELDSLRSPKVFDRETQLHPFHRSSKKVHFSRVLSKKQLDYIHNTFRLWLEKYNYVKLKNNGI